MSNFEEECRTHPADEQLFKRAILRAVPAVRLFDKEGTISAFFPLGTNEYGIDTILSCAKAIVAGECTRYQYSENPDNGLSFEISDRETKQELSNDT